MVTRLSRLLEHRGATVVVLLLVMAIAIVFKTVQKSESALINADVASLNIAYNMLQAATGGPQSETQSHSQDRAPGYALVLFGLAQIDPGLATALSCADTLSRCAPSDFAPVFIIQGVLAILCLVLLFFTAWTLSTSWYVAVLTLLLAFAAGSYGVLAGTLQPLIWPQTLVLLYAFFVVHAAHRDDVRLTLAAGAALGLSALFMPQLIVVSIFTALLFVVLGNSENTPIRHPLTHAMALITGTLVAGFLLLIATRLGYDTDAGVRQMTSQLAERIAYQSMDLKTWLASLIVPLPFIGGLAETLLGGEAVRNLISDAPHHVLHQAALNAYNAALNHSAHAVQQYAWLFKTRVLGDILSYLAVTPSILMRGLWTGTPIVTVLGLLHLKSLFAFTRSDGLLGPALLVFAPIIGLFVINALVTANQPPLNLGLVFLYAYATAYLVARMDVLRSRAS